jgi:hypothetical protein
VSCVCFAGRENGGGEERNRGSQVALVSRGIDPLKPPNLQIAPPP